MPLLRNHFIVFMEIDVGKRYIYYDITQDLLETIIGSIKKDVPFWFCGVTIEKKQIQILAIFRQFMPYKTLIMPNEDSLINKDINDVYDALSKGLVNGVKECTLDFLGELVDLKNKVKKKTKRNKPTIPYSLFMVERKKQLNS